MTTAKKEAKVREWCESACLPPGRARKHDDGRCANCNLDYTAKALLAVLDVYPKHYFNEAVMKLRLVADDNTFVPIFVNQAELIAAAHAAIWPEGK